MHALVLRMSTTHVDPSHYVSKRMSVSMARSYSTPCVSAFLLISDLTYARTCVF